MWVQVGGVASWSLQPMKSEGCNCWYLVRYLNALPFEILLSEERPKMRQKVSDFIQFFKLIYLYILWNKILEIIYKILFRYINIYKMYNKTLFKYFYGENLDC